MIYRQKFDTFIRRYDAAAYITNKSDFGGRIVDPSGVVFLDALSREPQTTADNHLHIGQFYEAWYDLNRYPGVSPERQYAEDLTRLEQMPL
jgi:hypothetical protein